MFQCDRDTVVSICGLNSHQRTLLLQANGSKSLYITTVCNLTRGKVLLYQNSTEKKNNED